MFHMERGYRNTTIVIIVMISMSLVRFDPGTLGAISLSPLV